MFGKIHIINARNHSGKILLDDMSESGIVKFPESFETGDRVQVRFQGDDPGKPIVNISVPGDKWHYGYLMNQFYSNGDLICTYPQMLGLIQYDVNKKVSAIKSKNDHAPVKFRIKKTQYGNVSAIDISEVEQEDLFKCFQPKFGKLEVTQERTKTGFVEKIVKSIKSSQNIISGVVKFVAKNKNDQLYGFIIRDDKGDQKKWNIYLPAIAFRKFYDCDPKQGDIVYFRTYKNHKGIQLKEFCEESKEEYLPKHAQYCIVKDGDENVRISLEEYEKFYKTSPEEGDIVYYSFAGRTVVLKKDDSEVNEIVVMKTKWFSKKANKEISQTLLCPKATFKNFVEVEPNELYYLYADRNNVKEVRKFNPDIKPEAIACYKGRNLPAKFRLEAIESLIRFNYSDKKNINQEKLHIQKRQIISQLQEEELKKGNYQYALKYEFRLQDMEYSPHRLAKYSGMNKDYDFGIKELFVDIKNEKSGKWEIITDEKDIDFLVDSEIEYNINLVEKKMNIESQSIFEKWKINIDTQVEIKPKYGIEEKMDLQIIE